MDLNMQTTYQHDPRYLSALVPPILFVSDYRVLVENVVENVKYSVFPFYRS